MVIGKHEGEISFDQFDMLIGQMVREFDQKGLIDRTPLNHRLEVEDAAGPILPRQGTG